MGTGRFDVLPAIACALLCFPTSAPAVFANEDGSIYAGPPFRRLFLDAMVTEQSDSLTRVFHSAAKHADGPVIRADRPWEGWGPYLYGTVLWDDGKLKLWYSCIGNGSNCEAAAQIGKAIAEKASAAGITAVKLDRGHNRYHGRVKAFADAAREAGLAF